MAMNIKGQGIVSKKEAPKTTKIKRAKDEDGKFLADDKSTPEVNEAWEGGYAPSSKKKARKVKSYKSK